MPNGLDDIEIHRINTGLFAYPALLVGFELGLFEHLAEGPRSTDEVARGLRLAPRAADALLTVALALGFLEVADGRYANSAMTTAFVLRRSPTSWAGYLDALIGNAEMYAYPRVRACLVDDAPQIYDGRDPFAVNAVDPERAARYTRWMHGVSQGPASAWPSRLDLSRASVFLDVAGGSGVHSIAAAKAYPTLRCVVGDLGTVGDVAREVIGREELAARVSVVTLDMWRDRLPDADVHFYSQIFHDWPEDACVRLARRSLDALPPGGRIVVHELLMDDDRAGPIPAVVVNLMMCLMYAAGRQYSGAELEGILRDAGFADVRRIPTYGHWHLVVGTKP